MGSNFRSKHRSIRSKKRRERPYRQEPMYKWIEINMLEGNTICRPTVDGIKKGVKAFLLFENLDKSTWMKTLSDSRSAYTSLKEHFLKHIEHPDDLSGSDPLTEDENVSKIRL